MTLDESTIKGLRALRSHLSQRPDGDAWRAALAPLVTDARAAVETSRDPYARGELLRCLTALSADAGRNGSIWLGDVAERLDRVLAAEPPIATFARSDWRTLPAEEKGRRIDHALALVRAAERDGRDPPSWRDLARETGVSRETLKRSPKLGEAIRDAEREAAASRRERLRRHAARSADRR
jgi:hypothetical protein